ncbi:MAG TPA: ABC transporter substrate-binding protein [Reyranellaceae bacterium]|nr:ABC transporter substrate-binding protein [Reyranellaceae bacterium]
MRLFWTILAALSLAAPAAAQDRLTIWWAKGFYKSEDDALLAAVKRYEQKSKVKVELQLIDLAEVIPRAEAALKAGNPPDIAYSDTLDVQVAGKWAADGVLEDITDVITPIKDRFAPVTVETAYLLNDKTRKKAYYAFPLKQQTLHIHYWRDMLADAGFRENEIPDKWQDYWAFWCDKVQPEHRKAKGGKAFGVGFPMGGTSTDSFQSFYSWMDAYNVRLVDDDGKPRTSDRRVREGMVKALTDYVAPYKKGCTPPEATTWKDIDNNKAFHERATILTHNYTISIAAKWLEDANNDKLTAEQRAEGRRAYDDLIATGGFPKKPDGSTMTYRASVKVGVIFQAAKNKAKAREFVQFLLQEENLRPYVEGALGRWFPVTKASQQSGFWQADKHRTAVFDQFAEGTRPFEFTKNWKFTILNNENVWSKAMRRVVEDKIAVEQAVDETIKRIEEVVK